MISDKHFYSYLIVFLVSLAPVNMAWAVEKEGAERNQAILPATWNSLGQWGSSPLRWSSSDLVWLAPAALGLSLAFRYDEALRPHMRAARGGYPDEGWRFAGMMGSVGMQGGIALLGYSLGRGRFQEISAAALQGLVISGVTVTAMKPALGSIRPSVSSDRQVFNYHIGSFAAKSFPSGHTFASFTVAEVYGSEYGRWWTYPLAGLVGYSRLYHDRHWTSDVLAGAIMGIAAGRIAMRDYRHDGPPAVFWSVGPRQRGMEVTLAKKF